MITFFASGKFDLYCDGYKIAQFVYLNDCMEYIRNHYSECDEFFVCNGDTGEVLFEIDK